MQERDASLNDKSIVFIGFMGVGKTTVGKLVAKKLNRSFIDIDEEIEKEYGMPCTDIFKKIGEKAFRQKEKEVITELSSKKATILSVGGGAFLQEEVRQLCLEKCIVVFLDLSWENWKDRIELIIDSRPVLQGKTMDEIHDLFNKRREIYLFHHVRIDTDYLNSEEVAEKIVHAVKNL